MGRHSSFLSRFSTSHGITQGNDSQSLSRAPVKSQSRPPGSPASSVPNKTASVRGGSGHPGCVGSLALRLFCVSHGCSEKPGVPGHLWGFNAARWPGTPSRRCPSYKGFSCGPFPILKCKLFNIHELRTLYPVRSVSCKPRPVSCTRGRLSRKQHKWISGDTLLLLLL